MFTSENNPVQVDDASQLAGRQGIFRRFQNSAVPLGFKWSLSIAALIVLTMGTLGLYLIQQQEQGYRAQVDRFSQVIVAQLVAVSGEPLMAADTLGLQGLVQRHARHPLVLGVAVYDADGAVLSAAGVGPPGTFAQRLPLDRVQSRDWENARFEAVTYDSPVIYQDVTPGYLSVSVDRSHLEADLAETRRVLVMSTLVMIALGVLLASWLAIRLSRPISNLARAGEALAAAHPEKRGERRDEIGQVLASFKLLAEGYRRKDQVEAALSRYVSPQVAQRVLTKDVGDGLGGHQVTGSVLFCDIVAFTKLSESLEPAEVAALLNDYFGYFALAAESCGGTVDKFIGDCIMIVFGVPTEDTHHALHALTCGMLIQQLTRRINHNRVAAGEPTVMLRVGISSGPMLAGNLGSVERMQYTVVGDTVNIAARLCSMADPGGVLVTDTMLASDQPGRIEHYHRLGATELRGRAGNVEVLAMDVDAVAHHLDADRLIDRMLAHEGGA